MNISINDIALELPEGATITEALAARQLPATGIAVAVNGKVVPAVKRDSHKLTEGDKVVVIKAFYGG